MKTIVRNAVLCLASVLVVASSVGCSARDSAASKDDDIKSTQVVKRTCTDTFHEPSSPELETATITYRPNNTISITTTKDVGGDRTASLDATYRPRTRTEMHRFLPGDATHRPFAAGAFEWNGIYADKALEGPDALTGNLILDMAAGDRSESLAFQCGAATTGGAASTPPPANFVASLETLVANVNFTSETDSSVEVLTAAGAPAVGAITVQNVDALLGAKIQAFAAPQMARSTGSAPPKLRKDVKSMTLKDFRAMVGTDADGKKIRAAVASMEKQLGGLIVLRMGEVEVVYLVAAKTATGQIVALAAFAVET